MQKSHKTIANELELYLFCIKPSTWNAPQRLPVSTKYVVSSLQWCHNECDGISKHRRLNCLLHHLIRCRSKKISKLCFTGLCEENKLLTSGFHSQRASNVENVSIWWCHHVEFYLCSCCAVCSIMWYWANNRQHIAHLRGWDMVCLLQWHHNECDGITNHWHLHCLLNHLLQAQIKENIKAPHHWPLWGKFTGDRWIPHTKGHMTFNRMAWQWAETLVEIRGTLADIRGTAK